MTFRIFQVTYLDFRLNDADNGLIMGLISPYLFTYLMEYLLKILMTNGFQRLRIV